MFSKTVTYSHLISMLADKSPSSDVDTFARWRSHRNSVRTDRENLIILLKLEIAVRITTLTVPYQVDKTFQLVSAIKPT